MPSKPKFPTMCWFQPERNINRMMDMRINTFIGPEVENAKALPPIELLEKERVWLEKTQFSGASVIVKRPKGNLWAHCIGILLSQDEPNRNNTPPNQLLIDEYNDMRARYPGVDIYLSLAGDKISSMNPNKPAEVQMLRQYAALCDHALVNFYNRNRNANTYPDTMTAGICDRFTSLTQKPAVPLFECNDQQLGPPPAPHVNRAPMPMEMQAQTMACQPLVSAVGWNYTCQSGKYGWPQSFCPEVDRNGTFMGLQYAMVEHLADTLIGDHEADELDDLIQRIEAAERDIADLQKQVADLNAFAAKTAQWIDSY